jgi:hypothetical protein
MKADWRDWAREAGFTVSAGAVEVRFESGRTQKVAIEDLGDSFLLRSTVVRPAALEELRKLKELQDPLLLAWQRNRAVSLVGFRVDEEGRMVGEGWVVKAGLTAAEFQLHVRTVAAECDRFEFQMTGRDVD